MSFLEFRDHGHLSELKSNFSNNLTGLNNLQKHCIEIVGKNKTQLNEHGIYELELFENTVNYVNYWKNKDENPYYLFNGIDVDVLNFYINRQDKILPDLDHYLNDPFYTFYYDLEGFKIHKKHVKNSIINSLILGKKYKCNVDYISRFSTFLPRQLAIKEIYI